MGTHKMTCEFLGDLELRFTKTVEAPRSLVWKAHTTPEMLQQWWGPKGFSHVDEACDVRPGGAWKFLFIGPDGEQFQEKIVFTELKEPELMAMDHGDGEKVFFKVRTLFSETGGVTTITTTMTFKDKASRDATAGHAEPGHASSMERLDAALHAWLAQAETTEGRELRATRFYKAPRRRVFQAWTDPAQLQRWWGPQGFSNEFHEFDLRPDGLWRFDMVGPKGERFPNHSEFQEVRQDELLRFEHRAPHFFTTVRFSDEAGGCRVDWSMVFDSPEAYRQIKSFAVKGNAENLDKLGALLKAEP